MKLNWEFVAGLQCALLDLLNAAVHSLPPLFGCFFSIATKTEPSADSGPPCVTSSVTSDSSADSGVDEVGSRHSQLLDSKTNIETMSVVSSLSNMSSEEGSDIGVSMTYDAKPPSSEPATGSNVYLDVLRKNKAGPTANHAPREHDGSNLVLTKVQFGAPPKIASKPQKAPPPASKSCKPAPPTPAASNAGDDATSFIATKPVTSWSVAEVGEWLRRLGLEQHVATFVENEIDGSHLPDLGKEELHELGVTRIGHRLSIEKSLKKLVKWQLRVFRLWRVERHADFGPGRKGTLAQFIAVRTDLICFQAAPRNRTSSSRCNARRALLSRFTYVLPSLLRFQRVQSGMLRSATVSSGGCIAIMGTAVALLRPDVVEPVALLRALFLAGEWWNDPARSRVCFRSFFPFDLWRCWLRRNCYRTASVRTRALTYRQGTAAFLRM